MKVVRASLSGSPLTIILYVALLCLQGAHAAWARVALEPCRNGVTPEKQIEIGKKAAQQVYQEMPVLPDDSPISQYVQALGAKLAAQAPGYRWPYNFHVVNVDDINAFALPGGSIFVNLGTIQAADTEAQLAGVMAHEISHVVLQHSVCNLEKQQRVGILSGLGQAASGVLLGDSAIGALAGKGIGLTAGLGFLKMSRGAEKQADLEGVGILYDTGYDPRAMPQFFETVEAKYGQGGAQLLSDHPNPGNRTEYISQEIATFEPLAKPIANTPDFREIHKQAEKMHVFTAKEVASGQWKRQSASQLEGAKAGDGAAETHLAARVDTALPASWTSFRGNGFSIDIPSGWQLHGDRSRVQIVPPNGVEKGANGGPDELRYGMISALYPLAQNLSLRDGFNALTTELRRQNPGLEPGPVNRILLGELVADTVECSNRPAVNGGTELDWIVGVPVTGAIRYFVFVAPESDFNAMRPTFERIANSIRLQ